MSGRLPQRKCLRAHGVNTKTVTRPVTQAAGQLSTAALDSSCRHAGRRVADGWPGVVKGGPAKRRPANARAKGREGSQPHAGSA